MKRLETLLLAGIVSLYFVLPAAALIRLAFPTTPVWAEETVESASQAERQEPKAPAQAVGEWPEPIPRVSLDLKDKSIADVLTEIAAKTNVDLAMTLPEGADQHRITLRLTDRPVTEALELVLSPAGLRARLEEKTLVVKPGDEAAEEEGASLAERAQTAESEPEALDHHGRGKGERHEERVGLEDRTVTGKSGRVEADETVGDAVAIGGSMTVAGHVEGDAVAIGGRVTLEPHAVVKGDAVSMGGGVTVGSGALVNGDTVAMGGTIDVAPDAKVHGDRVALGGSLGGVIGSIVGLSAQQSSLPGFVFSALSTLARAVALLVLGLLILAFMPERVGKIREYLVARPGASILGGMAVLFSFLPLCIVLAITLIGIPLIPVAVLALIALLVVGLTTFMVWLGYRIPIFEGRKSTAGALLIGLGICTLVDLIPLVGTLLLTLVGFASAGAALLSRLGKDQSPATAPAAQLDGGAVGTE